MPRSLLQFARDVAVSFRLMAGRQKCPHCWEMHRHLESHVAWDHRDEVRR